MKAAELDLHIDELALHGFAPGDRRRIAESLERELAALFAERGIPDSLAGGFSAPRIDGGSFESRPDATPEAIGAGIARAIYGGFGE